MVTHEIRVQIALTPSSVRWGLVLLLFLAFPRIAGTDDASTLTMYYPSPVATYSTLTSLDETRLAAAGGAIVFGDMSTDPKKTVGVGTTASGTYRLLVAGSAPNFGTIQVDGCIWLKNNNPLLGSLDNYRCRWQP